ncbi:MAG: CinA family protein [Christensenellales bacterium]
MGLADRDHVSAKKFEFSSDRTRNRERAVRNALNMLRLRLLEKEIQK